MIHRVARAAGVVVTLVVATAAGPRAQPVSAASQSVPFLDVPYISQSEALCGGAAAAMVMRYWGEVGIQADAFAHLVDARAQGIHGSDLVKDLESRGWQPRSFTGDAAFIAARLRDRQPVIALIEDRPGAFHYVVIVAWANGRVVLHDSARAPFRVMSETAFDSAWQKSNRWTLLVLPGKVVIPTGTAGALAPKDSPLPLSPCSGLVAQGIAASERTDQPAAIEMLRTAAELCPSDSAPSRELAGVYALQENWAEASLHATEAVRRNGDDQHAWRILATSRFVVGDSDTALRAWNHVAEPVLDIVNVQGLEHTRYLAAANMMRLRASAVLLADDLTAAGRRLAELPAAQITRVNYRPLENGRAAVDAVVIERSRSPVSRGSLVSLAVNATADREISTAMANPTGAGDLVSATWRWWRNRPRLAASYSTPTRVGGVLQADIFRDEQSYQPADADHDAGRRIREVRRGGNVSLLDWTSRGLRWKFGVGGDSWSGRGRTMTMTAAVDQRLFVDRLSLTGNGVAMFGDFGAATLGASATWRSSTRHEGTAVIATAGADLASGDSPVVLWPGAGTGHARSILLRAHPLLDDGVIAGAAFGRLMYHASFEARRWLPPVLRFVRVAPAVFIDAARADRRLTAGDGWGIDAGAGLRVSVPGSSVVRLDVGRGLRDGATALSIAWVR
ncbi:MAG: papain-like cysteine protease family protein [Vicinamibacterales bacterium]